MSKKIKIALVVVCLLGLVGYVLYQQGQKRMFEAHYVELPELQGKLIQGALTTPDGRDRVYEYYMPQRASDTMDIVYALHGSSSSGPDIRKQFAYEWDLLAEEHGFIVVYPTGFDNHWNDCRGKADYQANVQDVDDLTFLKSVENQIVTETNLSIGRRFAVGFSNGGHYCFKLVLEAPDWIDGIAAASANLPIADGRDCGVATSFVPTMIVNGTADWINPYDGGLVTIRGNDSRGTVHSSMETMAFFTGLGDCDAAPTVVGLEDRDPSDDSTIEAYTWKCKDGGIGSKLLKVNNGGHSLPHYENRLPGFLGTTNKDVIIAREMWDFFDEL